MSSNSGSTTTPAVPDWLNMAFVERRLQNHYKKEQIKVINFVIKSASGDLGNFGSKIYRANVTFSIPSSDQCAVTSEVGRPSNFYVNLQKKDTNFSKLQASTVNLIVKEAVSDELSLTAFLELDAYHKEMKFYDEIVPRFNEKLKLLGELELLAEAFGVCKQRNILMLDDLSVKGYKPRSPELGFNVPETKAVLKRLASFHAISAVLQEDQPNIFTNIKNGE